MGLQKWFLHLSSGLDYIQMYIQSQFQKKKPQNLTRHYCKINNLWDDNPTQIHRKRTY